MTHGSILAMRKQWALARFGALVAAGRREGWVTCAAVDVEDAVAPENEGTAMGLLASRCGLSAAEVDALWLLACVELDPAVSHVAHALVPSGMHELGAQLFEHLLDDADSSIDRLAELELIEVGGDRRTPLYRRGVRASDRVLDLARGVVRLDRSLAGCATLLVPRYDETPILLEVSRALALRTDALIVATGPDLGECRRILEQASAANGHRIIAVAVPSLAEDPATLQRQLRAIARECTLHDALPLLDRIETLTPVIERELLARHVGPALAMTYESRTWPTRRTLLVIGVDLPDAEQRADQWKQVLPACDDGVIEAAQRYRITRDLIRRTAATANASAARPSAVTADGVRAALRVQLERKLAGLARRIETRQTWNDLVLPVDQFDLLIEIVARVRHRTKVLDDWGFADKVGRGLGLSVLLSGPPGTGKTMIAGLLARELGIDLYQVDLSKVVSKYIGETEKQLAQVFEAAESGHAIVLFDEADSLFAKRTEVKSSNDRYANLEVNYLLQRIESFDGICVLTTNHETAIDPAFQRRLSAHVRVPMPEREQREQLWRAMIPDRAERSEDIDPEGLSELVMSGGYIKNAVLRAAYFAAAESAAITNAHLWRAARAECDAMGKLAFR